METKSDLIRCFIAIDLPREIINEVERVQAELKKKNIFHGKLTESENLHLTLKFLGEIDLNKIEEVKKRLGEIKFEKFSCFTGELGVFSKSYIRIVWMHVLGRKVLELQKVIDEKLKDLFSAEERFMSHLTIARVKNVKDKLLFLEELGKIKTSKIKFNVDKFYLIRSELREGGPVYMNLEEYSLI